MNPLKVTRCNGEGKGVCKRCKERKGFGLNWMSFLYKIEGYDGCYCFDCVKEILIEEEAEDAPTADVEPVVRGHWLTWGEKFPDRATGKNLGVFCSVCENHADYSSLYCPNCGAKMGDEDDGTHQ
nr:MAG TPA: PROTEIN/RNA Complex, archaeal, ribosomal, 50S, protein.0A [Caudoviricetes sp.]